MKRLIVVFLFFGISMLYLGCSDNSPIAPDLNQNAKITSTLDKKPSPKLMGDVYTNWTLTPPTFWNGTIKIEGVVYGIVYISYGAPRDFSKASPFSEDWIIYAEGTDWTQLGNVYMKGYNKGVTNLAHKPDPCKFVGNGTVKEAYGPFEMWLGRNVHEQGIIYWLPDGIFPDYAEFTFRIN